LSHLRDRRNIATMFGKVLASPKIAPAIVPPAASLVELKKNVDKIASESIFEKRSRLKLNFLTPPSSKKKAPAPWWLRSRNHFFLLRLVMLLEKPEPS